MGIVITVKPIRLNGEIVQPGTMITVADKQGLIDMGYARGLRKEETQSILSDYVRYAEKVFSKQMPSNRVKKAISHQRKLQVEQLLLFG